MTCAHFIEESTDAINGREVVMADGYGDEEFGYWD